MKVAEGKGIRAVLEMQASSLLSEGFREDFPEVVEEVYKMAEDVGVEGSCLFCIRACQLLF